MKPGYRLNNVVFKAKAKLLKQRPFKYSSLNKIKVSLSLFYSS